MADPDAPRPPPDCRSRGDEAARPDSPETMKVTIAMQRPPRSGRWTWIAGSVLEWHLAVRVDRCGAMRSRQRLACAAQVEAAPQQPVDRLAPLGRVGQRRPTQAALHLVAGQVRPVNLARGERDFDVVARKRVLRQLRPDADGPV